MSRIRDVYDDDNARLEVLDAIRTLKKYRLFDALVWKAIPETKQGFNTGDSEPLALAAGWSMGYKAALTDLTNPFEGLKPKNKENK